MATKTKISALLLVFVILSCGQRGMDGGAAPVTRTFPKAMTPAMIHDPAEIAEWMSLHFWDAFFEKAGEYDCDSTHVAGVGIGELEQQMANFIYVLDRLPLDAARKAVGRLSEKMEAAEQEDTSSSVFETFRMLGEKYLFDPNSPLRNEDFFQPMAQALSESRHMTDAERERFAHISKKCNLNRVGTRASDFHFCDRRGKEYTLYGVEAEYILLFFSNPGCESCMDIIKALKSMPKLDEMVGKGRMAVLNIYIDEDIRAWRDYMAVYPEDWYNGFDPDFILKNNEIYNVRAIPSLYLLDKDKNVILKDAVQEKLLNMIGRL